MATATITIPSDYGYVILATSSTFFLSIWHAVRVSPFRKAASVPYPLPYALGLAPSTEGNKEHARYLFNCVQRAHGNYLEHLPSVIPALLIAGVAFPRTAAALGAAWQVARMQYAVGYTRSDKETGKGRLGGNWYIACELALYGLAAWVGVGMLRAA